MFALSFTTLSVLPEPSLVSIILPTYNEAANIDDVLRKVRAAVPDADVLVVDGDPSVDVSVLGDRRRLRHVFSRGTPVDLDRPWPERRQLPGEKVGLWSARPLTWDLVHG